MNPSDAQKYIFYKNGINRFNFSCSGSHKDCEYIQIKFENSTN